MAKGKFTIQTNIQMLKCILDLCDGELNYEEIITELCNQFASENVCQVLTCLISNLIVVETSELSKIHHKLTMYPDTFQSGSTKVRPTKFGEMSNKVIHLPAANSNLDNILTQRKCFRDFGQKSLSLRTVSELLNVITVVENIKTYPSAGGFYPYDFIIYVNDSKSELLRGWYFLNKDQTPFYLSLILTNHESEYYNRIICDVFLASQKNITVFLVCNFDKHIKKYGNRGYKFAIAEGGSVIQNACLYAAHNGLHILPYGGFDEQFIINMLGIKNASIPFSFLIGSSTNKLKYSKEKENLYLKLHTIQSSLIKEKIITDIHLTYWSDTDPKNTLISAHSKFSVYSNTQVLYGDSGFGTGSTADIAKLKALMEVYERVVSSSPANITWKNASELDSFLNPIEYINQNRDFVESLGLYEFQIDDLNPWVKVCNFSESYNSYALMDQVYYGFDEGIVKRPLVTYGNSSGIAAHFDKQEAKLRSYFELIERDALMVLWYSKSNFVKIPTNKLASKYSFKINQYNKVGVKVHILDISIELPTFLVIFESDSNLPKISAGACSNLNPHKALQKAMEEAEFNFLSWREFGKFKEIGVASIREPIDHLLYYSSANNRPLS